jgi:N6-adenosine-specific RNA methylase IME4
MKRKIHEASRGYGKAETHLHYAGYALNLGLKEVERLVVGKAYLELGFGDATMFLVSIKVTTDPDLKLVGERRKALAEHIRKHEPKVSNRTIAKALNVRSSTIDRDLAANAAGRGKKSNQNKGSKTNNAANAAPIVSGAEAAKAVDQVTNRQQRVADKQENAIARTTAIEFNAKKIGKHAVIYADPPWCYEHPPIGASTRSIENHYPTMTLEQICSIPVAEIASDDAVLFLWATNPKLYECMKVLDAWDFEYRTNMVWTKDVIGMGYYAREQHELLLIAKRGNLPPPATETRPSSIIRAPRLEHSQKPSSCYDMIDTLYPGIRKIELFRRGALERKHWSTWGNEAAPETAEVGEAAE